MSLTRISPNSNPQKFFKVHKCQQVKKQTLKKKRKLESVLPTLTKKEEENVSLKIQKIAKMTPLEP